MRTHCPGVEVADEVSDGRVLGEFLSSQSPCCRGCGTGRDGRI